MQTRTAAGFEWFAGDEPTQNHSSVFATDFLLILTTSYTDQDDLLGTAVDDVASWSGSASRQDDASVKYEANRWGDYFQMGRDASGEWGMVLYDATEPRHANFYRESSESSVFNAVTGEFDGSSSVSGDSEVFLTGHEINEIPAEKNRFELNLETIFVDASSSYSTGNGSEGDSATAEGLSLLFPNGGHLTAEDPGWYEWGTTVANAWGNAFNDYVNPWDDSKSVPVDWIDSGLAYGTVGAHVVAVGATTGLVVRYIGGSVGFAALTRIGAANLPYRVPNTLYVRASRFLFTRTGYQQVVSNSWVSGVVRQAGWQWHHWAIPQATARAVGNAGLTRIAHAGWNLIPIPAMLNQSIGASGIGFNIVRVFIGTSPLTAAVGGYGTGSAIGEIVFGSDSVDD